MMKLINIINNYNGEGEKPAFYLKADTALLRNNDAFYVPTDMGRITASPHIVLKNARLAKCISERFASRCIDGVMAGVTFTAKEKLDTAKRLGLPWDEAVGFDHSSALSLETLDRDAMLEGAVFYINDEERARINLSDFSFTPDKIVSHLSECMTLRIGDLIYLGSPEEFEVRVGDNYKVVIAGKTLLNFDIK
ncbi:MAG: fumarylacetoacetate hydrolase family protein [Alistipes sp.]|nr:fumarylacetoacetate hydrolase family protein [Alistipes sp.]